MYPPITGFVHFPVWKTCSGTKSCAAAAATPSFCSPLFSASPAGTLKAARCFLGGRLGASLGMNVSLESSSVHQHDITLALGTAVKHHHLSLLPSSRLWHAFNSEDHPIQPDTSVKGTGRFWFKGTARVHGLRRGERRTDVFLNVLMN